MLTLFALVVLEFVSSSNASALERGLVALQHGNLAEARQELEQASRADPQNAYVWTSLAETYVRLKLPELASSAAKTAEITGSKDPLVCHALAMFYSESGQPGVAADWEQRFAQSPKADRDALARTASLYLEAGDAQRALTIARKAALNSSSAAIEDLLGRAFVATGQKEEGEKHLSAAWEQARTDPGISFDFADVLLKRENFTQAAEVIESALAIHPGNVQLTLALGVARYAQRRFEEALVLFLKVIKLDRSIEQPYLFVGRMLEQAGPHLAEIQNAYEEWSKREPNNARAQLLLAKVLLVEDHSSRRAEALLRRSIALSGRNWEAHYELGALLENTHEYQGAAAELRQSIELNAKEPMPHYHLARVYDRLGEPKRAEAERQLHQKLATPEAP